ncbi:hypothetical protein G6F37_001182 [Rhizopus arrhizus]|nr:hypothetical protein G6F38_006248 [Rhizopus arrhizus]KAG1163478.1 hypothetical protein G6F37_001182 [Rhizopus arrhizus]
MASYLEAVSQKQQGQALACISNDNALESFVVTLICSLFHILMYIHGSKLPSAAVIHKMIPDLCRSSCRLCASVDVMEDPAHFLFLSPKKLTIWRLIWCQFFGVVDVELSVIHQALYNLSFPRQKLRFIQNDTIVGCTFLGIWKAHWRFIFDDVPFDSTIVHNQILLMIASMRSNALHSLV